MIVKAFLNAQKMRLFVPIDPQKYFSVLFILISFKNWREKPKALLLVLLFLKQVNDIVFWRVVWLIMSSSLVSCICLIPMLFIRILMHFFRVIFAFISLYVLCKDDKVKPFQHVRCFKSQLTHHAGFFPLCC